jgi:nitrogen regulatory protein PII
LIYEKIEAIIRLKLDSQDCPVNAGIVGMTVSEVRGLVAKRGKPSATVARSTRSNFFKAQD